MTDKELVNLLDRIETFGHMSSKHKANLLIVSGLIVPCPADNHFPYLHLKLTEVGRQQVVASKLKL